jgi:glycosyltransferase involved in cell wall biosynthesis
MKILNINSYYLSSSVHDQLQNKLNSSHIHTKTYIPVDEKITIRDECNDIDFKNIEISKCFKKRDRFNFYYKHKKILNDFYKKNIDFKDFNLIHAHSLFSNGYIAYKINKLHKIPYIVTVRDTDINTFFKKAFFLRRLGVDILYNALKVIFLSNSYRSQCIREYVPKSLQDLIQEKSIVIPNGIDDFWIENKYKRPKIENSRGINLLYVGNIIKRKNLIRVMQACELIKKDNNNIRLVIVGKVIDKKIGLALKKSSLVKILNRMDKEALIEIYRENDIFVMPSITESFGLVYPEAMSQGMPVLYSKKQGFDGYFQQGQVGYAVESYNVKDIKNKILLSNQNYDYLSDNSVKYFERFSWKNIVIEYINLYGEYS